MIDVDGLSQKRRDLLGTAGNLLVLGGPGCGKTTIALLKAAVEAAPGRLQPGQRILFLSFARATITRVAQHASRLVSKEVLANLEITTYHGFIWQLLRSHGYLISPTAHIRLIAPPQAAAHLSAFSDELAQDAEKHRLFYEDGILHFDLFAETAACLLGRSKALARLLSDSYPVIILDEFQDTNAAEWSFIQALGASSRLIALADPDQRIYEFRGADPRRIEEFVAAYRPTFFNFADENHRSDGKDIVLFGNDLLRSNLARAYADVSVIRYGFYRGRNMLYPLKAEVLKRRRIGINADPDNWSMAVLVPSKRAMLQVSDYLSAATDGLPGLHHEVATDAEAPSLAAGLVAILLEGGATVDLAQRLISELCQHIRGRRGGAAPAQADLDLVGALGNFLVTGNIRGAKRQRVIAAATAIATARNGMVLTGDPGDDWLTVRQLLTDSGAVEFQQVAEDARYLRLLHRGAALRSRLGEIWRQRASYLGAPTEVETALLQEHFSAATKDWRGLHVMTIHKSKGKEFSEVVAYEGVHNARFKPAKATDREIAQARLALRVAVTRAMNHASVLTPKSDPSPLLEVTR